MKTRRNNSIFAWLFVVAASVAMTQSACDRSSQPPPAADGKARANDKYNADYIAALAAANEFCRAWRRGDVGAGVGLLSRRVRRALPDARIRDAIAGVGNPRHAGFEISNGEHVGPGQVAFRVRLLYTYVGQSEDRTEAPLERIVLQRDESGRWLVERFPLLEGARP